MLRQGLVETALGQYESEQVQMNKRREAFKWRIINERTRTLFNRLLFAVAYYGTLGLLLKLYL